MRVDLLYRFFIALRLFGVFACFPGYIHPDEFFQSAEVIAGDVFHTDVYRPWEFNRTNPIRTVAFSYLTCGVPFYLLRYLSQWLGRFLDTSLLTSYTLLVAPRLMVTLLSFLLDIFMYKTCRLFGKDPWKPLLILATSYITHTYHSRPFSNTIESILFAAVLYYVLRALHDVNRMTSKKHDSGNRCYGNLYCYQISFFVMAGIYNRPTFVMFVFAPILFWIQYGLRPVGSNVNQIAKRIVTLSTGSYFTMVLLTLLDSLYYGYVSIEDLLDVQLLFRYNKLVWTPVNFVMYNAHPSNLAQHGLHPFWLHGLFHLPLLFVNLAVMGIFGYWKMVYSVIKKGSVDEVNPVEALVRCSFIVPLILLSVFPHQEPRFLTPLLFPLVYLHGESVWKSRRSFSLAFWVKLNIFLFTFYAYFHQGGLIPTLNRATKLVADIGTHSQVHLVFFHTYMPPRHLVTVPVPHAHVTFHDLKGVGTERLRDELIKINFTESAVFLFSPNSLNEEFELLHDRWRLYLVHQEWPHFSAEDLPPIGHVKSFLALEQYIKAFSLDLYNVTLQKDADVDTGANDTISVLLDNDAQDSLNNTHF